MAWSGNPAMAGRGGVEVAIEDKYDRLKHLMDAGKEKGYVLYDEVSDLLPDDVSNGPELDDILVNLDGAGVEILEEPKLEKIEDSEELLETDLGQDFSRQDERPRPHVSRARWEPFRC